MRTGIFFITGAVVLPRTTVMEPGTTIDLAVGAVIVQNRCSQESALKILKMPSKQHEAP